MQDFCTADCPCYYITNSVEEHSVDRTVNFERVLSIDVDTVVNLQFLRLEVAVAIVVRCFKLTTDEVMCAGHIDVQSRRKETRHRRELCRDCTDDR